MRERLRARFLGNGESLGRKTYLWTVVSGLMFAGSSVIMLWAVTHIVGVDEGGVFSIAFAVSPSRCCRWAGIACGRFASDAQKQCL
ncbi:MAG: hypothetical protein ACLT0Y_00895 [Christensenellales bacterium]